MSSLQRWLGESLRTVTASAGQPKTRRAAPPRKNRARPGLESLEGRCVPTILFTPHFSGTTEFAPPGLTISQEHANSLSSPSVVLIFSGSYWTTTNGSVDRQSLTTAIRGILGSGYLSALDQYGSDGRAVYYGSFQDNATPTLTVGAPTAADLQSYVQSEVKSHPGSWATSWASITPTTSPSTIARIPRAPRSSRTASRSHSPRARSSRSTSTPPAVATPSR